MNNYRTPNYETAPRRNREPLRFVSFVEQLHRQAQQHRTTTDTDQPHEAPLVSVTRRLVRATWLLVVVGFLSFGAALLQWLSLRNADSTAQSQLEASKTESIIRLRAYLSVIPSQSPFEVGKPAKFAALAQVGGQSPAIDVSGWGNFNIKPYPLSSGYAFIMENKTFTPFENKITLNPSGTVSINMVADYPMSQESIDALHTISSIRYYIWGEFTYKDVFGCKRLLKYCFSSINTVDPFRIDPCPQNNESEGDPGACPK